MFLSRFSDLCVGNSAWVNVGLWPSNCGLATWQLNLLVGRRVCSRIVVMTGTIVRVWVVGTRPGDTSTANHGQTDTAAGFNWYYSGYNNTNL